MEKVKRKLYWFNLLVMMVFLTSCSATPITYSSLDAKNKMSIEEARSRINGTVKDMEDISKITVTDKEIIRYYKDGQVVKKPLKIIEVVTLEYDWPWYNVYFGPPGTTMGVTFVKEGPAKTFASALDYLVKHIGQDNKREKVKSTEDCLRQVRNTPIDLILAGATAGDLKVPCAGVPQDQIEGTLNDMLVEWKSSGLYGLLQRSSSTQLKGLIVKMEKGILKLDLKAKQLKDIADENARQVKAPGQAAPATKAPDTLTVSHLLDQRKTLLMVILGSVKQVAAQKRG